MSDLDRLRKQLAEPLKAYGLRKAGRELGVTHAYLSMWLSGKRDNLTLDTLYRLCDLLGFKLTLKAEKRK